MMQSLFSGVSGLENHQTRMNVIGNNIANVNTYGFKKSRVTFEDMIYQTLQGASAPTTNLGGTDAKQVGLGMNVASIDTIMNQGSLQATGNKTDLSIQGNGFFVLKNGDQTVYTRDGAFGIDKDGHLDNPATGMRVQGWTYNNNNQVDTNSDAKDIVLPIGGKLAAKGTDQIKLMSNLDLRSNAWSAEKTVYDSQGNQYKLQMNFSRNAQTPVNTWNVNVTMTDSQGNPVTINQNPNFTMSFDNSGVLSGAQVGGTPVAGTQNANGTPIAGADVSVPLTFTMNNTNPNLVNAAGTPTNQQTINMDLGNIGDYKHSVTQFASNSTTHIYDQDGYNMGYLSDIKVDQSGVVTGVYTNGHSAPLAQVALATFTNPEGLTEQGSNNFAASNNSGSATISVPGKFGGGAIEAGTLEMSNVDLAQQFTDMITTERGFQANSKTITTSDQMLQTLLTLKQ